MRTLALFSLLLTLSCSGGKDASAPAAPMAPGAPDPAAAPGTPGPGPGGTPNVSAGPVVPNPQVRPLAPGEAVTCQTMCGQLAHCNLKVHGKQTSSAALAACVSGCGARRGESDKARWEAMETCLKKHGGEDCAALRGCIDAAMLELQKQLHGKEPTPPTPDPEVKP